MIEHQRCKEFGTAVKSIPVDLVSLQSLPWTSYYILRVDHYKISLNTCAASIEQRSILYVMVDSTATLLIIFSHYFHQWKYFYY